MAKANSEIIRMNSTGKTKDGRKTGYFYTTRIGKAFKQLGNKLRFRRFDPRAYNEETGKFRHWRQRHRHSFG